MHAVDARVKIVLVLVYSVCLFLVNTWTGIGLLALLAIIAAALARLDIPRIARMLMPVVFILIVTLLVNSFVLDVTLYDANNYPDRISAGIFADMPAIALIGSFGFVPAGFARGCYFVLRIVLLLVASLVLTTTSSSTEITQALSSFMRPLNRFGLPTHDIATVVSIALRFIPVTIDEFQMVRMAQTSRGASFDTGKLTQRLKTWTTVLVPVFVALYRRADTLALAMDARCYGGSAETTQLTTVRFSALQAALLICGCAFCFLIAYMF